MRACWLAAVAAAGPGAVAAPEPAEESVVENVFRRLQENAAAPADQRKSFVRVIYDASNEIRSSVVFATVIIVIAWRWTCSRS